MKIWQLDAQFWTFSAQDMYILIVLKLYSTYSTAERMANRNWYCHFESSTAEFNLMNINWCSIQSKYVPCTCQLVHSYDETRQPSKMFNYGTNNFAATNAIQANMLHISYES